MRLKVSGGDLSSNPLPVLAVHKQVFELPSHKDGCTKHMLGGRISIRVVRQPWEGPFIEIMPADRRKKYEKSFRSFDLDGSGTIDAGELATAFEAFGLNYTPEEITNLIMRYMRDDRKGDLGWGEMTFDEFCEMMEAERRDGHAFFVSAVRVALPKNGVEDLLMDSGGSIHALTILL